ncbi:MAG: helicase-related protein [candidate division WOR-3 bacterium]
MTNFITNSPEKPPLSERLRTLIRNSNELKFLVGFFYFSGVQALYDELKSLYDKGKIKDGHLKILIGLNVDLINFNTYEVSKLINYAQNNTFFNLNQIKDMFFNSLKNAFNSIDLDNEHIYEQVSFFLKLLEEGKIILRKTREPNHAKLYLFKFDDSIKEVVSNLFITGSSNLTRAGLESQNEFNVEIKDYGFDEAEKYFDKHWIQAVEITKDDIQKIIKIIKEESFLREITPFEAYVYLLKTYVELNKGHTDSTLKEFMKNKGYEPYNYQIEAVAQAVQNCIHHGGTLLADVVGLGKTIIACLIAKVLGKRGIVICPPHLVGDDSKTYGWKKYIEDFELWGWEVRSLGKLDEVLDYVKNKNFEIVIVDEAHRFKNERTIRYHYLKEICRGKTVILLTATPFNNRPSDIFALLKLFSIPKKSTIVYDEDLFERFSRYERTFYRLSYALRYANSPDLTKKERALKYYNDHFNTNKKTLTKDDLNLIRREIKHIANQIRIVIEPITIRRNRLDLKYYGEKINTPEVKDPQGVFFELTKEQSKFYDWVIESFLPYHENGRFTGAIYFPARYERVQEEISEESEESFMRLYQENLYDFMRRLLVKRFESSFGAFKESIERFINIHKAAIEFIEKTGKFILDRKKILEILSTEDPDETLDLLADYERDLKEHSQSGKISRFHKIYEVTELGGFLNDIKNDYNLLNYIKKEYERLGFSNRDPKAEKLCEILREWVFKKKRKVVIFTEYLDTAKYLKEILEKAFPGMVLSAFGSLTKEVINHLNENFDAQYSRSGDERFKILLTTDKLSEGFNLNKAGVVINYDIPWNPVRVIQRVGRINRIGKRVFDEIYILHFFPTEQGADITRQREIAESKMFMIHNVLGEDAKIFSPDEEPQPSALYNRLTKFPEEEEEESFFTKLRKELREFEEKYPMIMRKIESFPKRVKTAKTGEKDELLVFIKKGKDIFVGYKDYNEKKASDSINIEDAFNKLRCDESTKALPLSERFWEAYRNILGKQRIRIKPHPHNSLENKAHNLVSSILNLNHEELGDFKSFLEAIRTDIAEYGTLSEYTLQLIVDLEEYLKLNDITQLKENLTRLRKELGEDFLEKTLKRLENLKEEIIVAVENQKRSKLNE